MSNQPVWSLAELDDLRAYLGDKVMQGDNITTFELLLKQISAFMENHTHRKLKARDYSYLVVADEEDAFGDGDGTTWFHTKQYPINSITTLIIGDTEIDEGDWNSAGYIVYKKQGRIYYENGFDSYRKNIKLIYNAGYTTSSEEYADLNLVCCVLCKYIWDNKGKLGLKAEYLGRYRYQRGNFKDTDQWVFDILDRYKRSSFSRYIK
jgi:hypothetical protein